MRQRWNHSGAASPSGLPATARNGSENGTINTARNWEAEKLALVALPMRAQVGVAAVLGLAAHPPPQVQGQAHAPDAAEDRDGEQRQPGVVAAVFPVSKRREPNTCASELIVTVAWRGVASQWRR